MFEKLSITIKQLIQSRTVEFGKGGGGLSQETGTITLIYGSQEISELSLLALCYHYDKVYENKYVININISYSICFLSRSLERTNTNEKKFFLGWNCDVMMHILFL